MTYAVRLHIMIFYKLRISKLNKIDVAFFFVLATLFLHIWTGHHCLCKANSIIIVSMFHTRQTFVLTSIVLDTFMFVYVISGTMYSLKYYTLSKFIHLFRCLVLAVMLVPLVPCSEFTMFCRLEGYITYICITTNICWQSNGALHASAPE